LPEDRSGYPAKGNKRAVLRLLTIVIMCNKSEAKKLVGKSMNNISELGKTGEIIAANYLERNGYEILETNFQNKIGYRVGEIDIIACEKRTGEIAFVEVKTRQKGSRDSENPELAITRAKYKKLTRIIERYLRQNNLEDTPHRLDAIAIEIDTETKKARLRHLKYIYY
jgi:putative endonuclease